MTTTSLTLEHTGKTYLSLLKNILLDNSSLLEPYYDLTSNISVTNSSWDLEIAHNKESMDFKKSELLLLFNQQFTKYNHYIISSDAASKTNRTISLIGVLGYKKCAVEITPDNSLFFNLKFENDITTHIEFYFEPSGGNTKEAFFTIYKGDDIVLESFGEMKTIIQCIEHYFFEK